MDSPSLLLNLLGFSPETDLSLLFICGSKLEPTTPLDIDLCVGALLVPFLSGDDDKFSLSKLMLGANFVIEEEALFDCLSLLELSEDDTLLGIE